MANNECYTACWLAQRKRNKKARSLEVNESKLKSVKRLKHLTVFSIYFTPKLVHTSHVFIADVKKNLFTMFSQKLTDKYSQTLTFLL